MFWPTVLILLCAEMLHRWTSFWMFAFLFTTSLCYLWPSAASWHRVERRGQACFATKSCKKSQQEGNKVGWGFSTPQKFPFLFLRQWPRYGQKAAGCQEWRLLPTSTGSPIVKIKMPKSSMSSFNIQEKVIAWHSSKRDIFLINKTLLFWWEKFFILFIKCMPLCRVLITVNLITEIHLTLGIITEAQNELRIQIRYKNTNSYRKISLVYCRFT